MDAIEHKFPNGVVVKLDFHDDKEYQEATKKSNPYGETSKDVWECNNEKCKFVKRIKQ